MLDDSASQGEQGNVGVRKLDLRLDLVLFETLELRLCGMDARQAPPTNDHQRNDNNAKPSHDF
jgi:hypothetical protein